MELRIGQNLGVLMGALFTLACGARAETGDPARRSRGPEDGFSQGGAGQQEESATAEGAGGQNHRSATQSVPPLPQAGASAESADVWGDGVDSDGDGQDAPNCEFLKTQTPQLHAATTSCRAGPDVYLQPTVNCWHCCSGGLIHTFVANRGDAAFTDRLRLHWSGSVPQTWELYGALQPGEASLAVSVSPRGSGSFWLELFDTHGEPVEDCNPGNERLDFEFSFCPCIQ